MLVGDSDLATATTGAQGSGEPPRLRLSGGSWSTGGRPSSGSAGGPPAAVVALSSSWDVADGAGVVGLRDVLAMPHLGGSAPTCGAAGSPRPSAHGSAPQRPGSQVCIRRSSSAWPALPGRPGVGGSTCLSSAMPLTRPPAACPPLPAPAAAAWPADSWRHRVEPRLHAALARGEEARLPAGAFGGSGAQLGVP